LSDRASGEVHRAADLAPSPRATAQQGEAEAIARCRLVITGIVQGVGFRPFIHRLATRLGLSGWVLNSTEGVVVEVEGKPDLLDRFARAIPLEAPPRAHVDRIDRTYLPPIGYTSFAIEASREPEGSFALISPDISICDDCLREMRDPADRRYRYPFINCTNCGPRFTVVADIPYDRPRTTMACFPMCPDCEREYHQPSDRRFHAQPNACPRCGPRLWLVRKPYTNAALPAGAGGENGLDDAAIGEARRLLAAGAIVAIKGLGGFHLACDATNDAAVAELRRRKRRSDKPFAVMAPDPETVAGFCHLSEDERRLLESPQRPIVLLRRREGSPISPQVAPNNRFLGVMLPYTPLHHLLLEQEAGGSGEDSTGGQGDGEPKGVSPHAPAHGSRPLARWPVALVMTSGNMSEEPIATGNREALERLDSLADAFLLHNRDIQVRCDDSVTRLFRGREAVIRRSRGYAPFPVRLGFEARDLLACGAELKSTFCITKGSYAFLSQHIGDLQNVETLDSYARSIEHFRRLFRLEITGIAHDLHPEYLSTRYALEMAESYGHVPLVPVQHHHAHVAACMAENGVDETVIGVSFDGTGYGADGLLWGGEFLVCHYGGYRRAAHLKYLPLPGGEAAIVRPYRMAISFLLDSFGPREAPSDLPPCLTAGQVELELLRRQIEARINSPLTSSVGRLFDAVSALVGLRQVVNYEGQAAIELEMAATTGVEERYGWALIGGDGARVVDVSPTIREIAEDVHHGTDVGIISARFHNTVADIIASVCREIRGETGLTTVALSGGVFQNLLLLERACRLLEAEGFRVLTHHQVPPNDGGLALGQAVIASRMLSLGSGARAAGPVDPE